MDFSGETDKEITSKNHLIVMDSQTTGTNVKINEQNWKKTTNN